ncbi:MAG: OadG-related small transporter subunit [Halanaerobiales bacterium]
MNLQAFLETLPIVLCGMGGIFIVMGIIYLSIKLVNIFFVDNEKNNN